MKKYQYDINTGLKRIKTKLDVTKTLMGLVALALPVVLFLLTNGAKAAGPVCNVPTVDYPTIQSAVNDATCTTINVAPGAYAESVTIPRSVVINGAQAGVDARTRVGLESTVTGTTSAVFTVQAASVTIDGFSVKNPGQGLGIVVKTAGNDAFIKNNIVDTIGGTGFSPNTVGVYLELGPDNVKVVKNRISNIVSVPSAQGVLVGDSTSADPSLNALIKENLIENITSENRGAYGVQVNNGASLAATATGFTTGAIEDNTINNLVGFGWAHAIGLEGDTPNIVVEGNSITNLVDQTPAGFNNAIAVFFENNPSFATGEVHQNNFNLTAVQYGIAVSPVPPTSTALVDGDCNWWNSPSGPTAASNPGGTGAQVTPNVDYKPWLLSPAPGGACIGGNVATDKDQCKNGGWQTMTDSENKPFKNQGDCVSFVATKGKNKANG